MNTEAATIRLTIPSRLTDVALVGSAVTRICTDQAELDDVGAYHIALCAVEAINNVIRHSLGGVSDREVRLDLSLHEDRIVLVVIDDGPPVPNRCVETMPAHPFDSVDIERAPTSGMGLYILHQIMDSVEYEYRSGQNVLTLTKKTTQMAPQAS